ncbi:hypothetical protein FOZ63_014153, partial [Perkinsus olseni]
MRLWTAGKALRRSAVTSTRRGFGSSSSATAAAGGAENELGKYADMPAVAVHKGYKMVMSLSICRLPPVAVSSIDGSGSNTTVVYAPCFILILLARAITAFAATDLSWPPPSVRRRELS